MKVILGVLNVCRVDRPALKAASGSRAPHSPPSSHCHLRQEEDQQDDQEDQEEDLGGQEEDLGGDDNIEAKEYFGLECLFQSLLEFTLIFRELHQPNDPSCIAVML